MNDDEYRAEIEQCAGQLNYSKFSDEHVDQQLKQVYDLLLQQR